MTPEKRKRIIDLIHDTYKHLDPIGANGKKYVDFIENMDDKELEKWIGKLKSGEDNLRLEIIPFKNEPSLDDIEKAAEVVGVPLHSRVIFRHDGMEYKTKEKVPVGYINIKRLQQILEKKMSYNVNNTLTNQITGQLAGDSDVARVSVQETYALTTMSADETLKEMMGPRSDNLTKKEQFYQALERDGFVRQDEILGDVKSQRTLNFLNTLLIGAGLWSDLVDESYFLTTNLKDIENADR